MYIMHISTRLLLACFSKMEGTVRASLFIYLPM